jgi:hypothetical protein
MKVTHGNETSPLVRARVAGLLALVILVSGSFGGFVHAKLVVPEDAVTTANNIRASESLFRLGFASGLVMYTFFILYVVVLYQLLKKVNKTHALLMLSFALVGVAIAMLNQVNQSAALLLLSGVDYLKAFTADQIHAQMMIFLRLHSNGNLIGAIFWGLWLFPLGLLVFRSGYFPRILGILLMIGCFGWLVVVVQRFLLPGYPALAYSRFAAHIAELLWMVWLLIKGVNVEQWQKSSLESA